MPATPPRKTSARKTAATEPVTAARKPPARGEVVVPAKKFAAVEPAAVTPKLAKKSVAVKPKTPATKSAGVPTAIRKVAAAQTKTTAAEPKHKSPARIHAAPATLAPQERHHLVKVAAYYIAERRGFGAGSHHDDWVQAEREVDAMIAAGKFGA